MSNTFKKWQNREISDIECIRELEHQNKELKEIGLMLKDRIISVLNNKPVNDLDEIIARLEKYEKI